MRLVTLSECYYITLDGRDIIRRMPDGQWYRVDAETGLATLCLSKGEAARQIARLRLDLGACG
jgi:hypothetical protein